LINDKRQTSFRLVTGTANRGLQSMYGVYRFVFLPILKISLHRVQRADTSIFQNEGVVCLTDLWQLSWLLTILRHLYFMTQSLITLRIC